MMGEDAGRSAGTKGRSRCRTLATLAACAALTATAAPVSADVGVGDRAAEFRHVEDASGKRVRLRAYRGKVVVMSFGASWCAPCKAELPELEKLARRYKKKGADVAFLAVNVDSDRSKGRKFIEEAGLEAVRDVYDTKKATVKVYDPPKMPTTFIIGKRGLVRKVHGGYEKGDERALAKAINPLL